MHCLAHAAEQKKKINSLEKGLEKSLTAGQLRMSGGIKFLLLF